MIPFLIILGSVSTLSNADYLGSDSSGGSLGGGSGSLSRVIGGFEGIEIDGYVNGGSLGGSGLESISLGVGGSNGRASNGGGSAFGNTKYSFSSFSGGSTAGGNAGGGGGYGRLDGGAGVGATVGVATVPSGPAVAYPTAFSAQSRFDIIHPGSIVQQTVSQVPVVSTHIRPVIAIGRHHGHH